MADKTTEKGKAVPVRQGGEAVGATEPSVRGTLTPPVDMYEDKDTLVLTADMPGVRAEDLKLEVDGDVLNIQGTVNGDARVGEPLYAEFEPGDYVRAFALGDGLDASRISAALKNGVLTLVLPKAEKAKTRKIEVRAQ
jgi:HSP20 family protein